MLNTKLRTNRYMNEVVSDAIRLIRKGESAFVYSLLDVKQIKKIMGADNLDIIVLNRDESKSYFGYNGILYIVSYNEKILETMALAVEKIYILSDMGFRLSKRDKQYLKNSLSRTEVERRFWELYDIYTEEI